MNILKLKALCRASLVIMAVLTWSACGVRSAYYQKQVPVPGARWKADFMPSFKLDITDTAAKYACYLLLRHDESYPNSNLWFRMKVKEPGARTWTDGPRLEVQLADAEGKWQGRGMGGIWEHRIWLGQQQIPRFTHAGTYEIRIEQLMRYNPLPSVMNVGLIVERISP